MRKFLIAAPMALAAAAMLTSPASAAPGNRYNNVQITKEINQLDRKIDRAQQQRSISPREANQLHREVRQEAALLEQVELAVAGHADTPHLEAGRIPNTSCGQRFGPIPIPRTDALA